jgi:hypothetical protein
VYGGQVINTTPYKPWSKRHQVRGSVPRLFDLRHGHIFVDVHNTGCEIDGRMNKAASILADIDVV